MEGLNMPESNWFANCYRQGFKNLGNGPMVTTYNARQLARYWKETGAEVVYMNGIFQSHVMFPTANSELDPFLKGRDLMAEFTDECLKLGIRSGAYITPFEHFPFTKGHPEYSQTDTAGKIVPGSPSLGGEPYWACWNTPFLDRMCALISEMYTRYPLEAAFFDGLLSRHGVCHCPSCTARFKADTGFDLPGAHDMADPAFRSYYHWKNRTLTEACRRLVAATRARNPNVQVVSNTPVAWCNWCSVQPETFFDATEWTCTEVQAGADNHGGYIHPSSVGLCAFKLAYTRGQHRDHRKVQAYNWVGQSSANIDLDLMLEMKAAIAQGGLPCIQGDQPVMKQAFDYIRTCEPYLRDTTPVPWVALAASQIGCDTHRIHEAAFGPYFEDIQGLFAALLDLRLPVEFLSGRDLGEGGVKPYAVLVLSDVGYITASQAAEIRQFVRAGGGLIATGQTSLIGEDGKILADFALADVLGVSAAPDPAWAIPEVQWSGGYAYLDFQANAPWWGDTVQPSLSAEAGETYVNGQPWLGSRQAAVINSPFQMVKASPQATVEAVVGSTDLARPARYPGIVTHRYGQGRVVYLAPRLGEIYARYPYAMWQRVLRRALDLVAPRPPAVEVSAPQCVSAYTWEQPDTHSWMVHLINDLDETGRPRGRMGAGRNQEAGSVPRTRTIAVDGVEVIVRKPGATRAHLPLEGRPLPVEHRDGALHIQVGRVGQHALIVVE
jgi:hypothetical protein